MKILYNINKIVLIITIVLYLTIIFGLYAQIVLGVIQILTAISLLFLLNSLKKEQKLQLLIYWLLVILYGIRWYIKIDLKDFWWLGIIVIPMCIAGYFLYILRHIKNINN